MKRQLTPEQKARIQERTAKHAQANHDAHVAALEQAVERAKAGWNASRSARRGFMPNCGR